MRGLLHALPGLRAAERTDGAAHFELLAALDGGQAQGVELAVLGVEYLAVLPHVLALGLLRVLDDAQAHHGLVLQLIAAFGALGGLIFGIDPTTVILKYVLPVMGGGNGAGAVPMSEIYEKVTNILSEEFVYPSDIITALQADEETWQNFQQFSESYKRIRVAFVHDSRNRPEFFEKRLANLLKMTKQNKKIIGHGGIDKYY